MIHVTLTDHVSPLRTVSDHWTVLELKEDVLLDTLVVELPAPLDTCCGVSVRGEGHYVPSEPGLEEGEEARGVGNVDGKDVVLLGDCALVVVEEEVIASNGYRESGQNGR